MKTIFSSVLLACMAVGMVACSSKEKEVETVSVVELSDSIEAFEIAARDDSNQPAGAQTDTAQPAADTL